MLPPAGTQSREGAGSPFRLPLAPTIPHCLLPVARSLFSEIVVWSQYAPFPSPFSPGARSPRGWVERTGTGEIQPLPPGSSRGCASRQPQGPTLASLRGLLMVFPCLSGTASAEGAAPLSTLNQLSSGVAFALGSEVVPCDPLLPTGAVCSRPSTQLTVFSPPRRGSRASS